MKFSSLGAEGGQESRKERVTGVYLASCRTSPSGKGKENRESPEENRQGLKNAEGLGDEKRKNKYKKEKQVHH